MVKNLIKLFWFIFPFLVIILCWVFCIIFANYQNSKCKQQCPKTNIEIISLGFVKTPDEECKIEEVVESSYQLVTNNCSCYQFRKPLVRKIVCPSGKNGQSTVTDDGTKFHREVLK